MNRVPLARRTQIINCLVEGNSIRSTERLTNTHRDTIMRLMVEVGGGCAKLMNEACLSGYHPHPLYVVCLLGLQARAGAGALRRRSG